ncbi:zinc finger protein 596-like [Venturia canescens]|uniref:zinc finger protein 596-like n=1 Tax=Venturia canescens TaxID=32260 RepID=UPI001C9C24F4|nr:zinc finger protein 596-like [Venturia canescens]XP_043267747.1 zinc finger protein 596-like [Venturia canescens]
MVNADCSLDKMGSLVMQSHELNGSAEGSLYPTMTEVGSRVYKLSVQIEKIRPKPCPKSKKLQYLGEVKKEYQWSGSAGMQNKDENSGLRKREKLCLICNESFQSAQSLYLHKKKHHRFVCPICDAYCSTRVLCDRHEKLHVSDDPELPHKCHLCSQKFDTKRNVRLHTRVMHTSLTSSSVKSSMSPMKSPSNVLKLAQSKLMTQPLEKLSSVDIKEKISRRSEGRNTNNHDAVTYSCRVCSRDFPSVEAAESHSREHLEELEKEHKCNICKKTFKNEMVLNTHLAQHLSRALRCPVCPKAFINRATLRIHMKSHG